MSDNPHFQHRNASDAAFWSERFEKKFTPWDKGGVPVQFQQYSKHREHGASDPASLCLIPGCGTGYEAAYLSESGWDVIAIDFSAAAVASAHARYPKWRERIIEADFFSYEPEKPLGMIYERAFLCALPPEMRARIVARWVKLLPIHAVLVGYFYIAENKIHGGPPFSITQAELINLMSPHFECVEDKAALDSLPVFKNSERWQIWKRV